jgi:hypothetical protein
MRETTTLSRKAATARKIAGSTVPSTRCPLISLSSIALETWSARPTASWPPNGASAFSMPSSAARSDAPGARRATTWLKAPRMS